MNRQPIYLKLAVTDWFAVSTNVHVVDVPEQAPPQPVKVTPGSGVAVNETLVFAGKLAEQPAPVPQEMPAGLLETVP